MNKSGQQMTLTTLILIILGMVVLVLLIFGFTTGWDYFFSKIGLLPDDLNTATEACKNYATLPNLALSFCQFRELTIEGKKGFYNCPYLHGVAIKIIGDNVGFDANKGSCASDSEVSYCKQLRDNKESNWQKIIVNGDSCEEGYGVQPEPEQGAEIASQ